MSRRRLGIAREWKSDAERRTPLLPSTVARLVSEESLEVFVQPSPFRVHSDQDYAAAGAVLQDDLSSCDFLLGIKEFPLNRLVPGRPHLYFSHTIKGQSYNMPGLKRMLDIRATLLDYELVRDEAGQRLIFFGRQAGQAGIINSLWMLGKRWQSRGIQTPFADLRQAKSYGSLEEAKLALERAGRQFVERPPKGVVLPLVIGVTGDGNVAKGVHELLDLLRPTEIAAEDLLRGAASEGNAIGPIVRVRFGDEHYARPRDESKIFDSSDYRRNPKDYVGRFHEFLPHISLLVTGHYWDSSYPRFVTRDWLREAFSAKKPPRLEAIGDISCDIGGAIASTVRASTPDDPLYVYDPFTGTVTDGIEGPGLAVMAVDILPTEIARDSSEAFDRHLAPWIAGLVRADWSKPIEELMIPAPFRRAIIAHHGALSHDAQHLAAILAGV